MVIIMQTLGFTHSHSAITMQSHLSNINISLSHTRLRLLLFFEKFSAAVVHHKANDQSKLCDTSMVYTRYRTVWSGIWMGLLLADKVNRKLTFKMSCFAL